MQDRIIATSSSLGPRPRMRGKEDVIVAVPLAEVVQYDRDVVEIARAVAASLRQAGVFPFWGRLPSRFFSRSSWPSEHRVMRWPKIKNKAGVMWRQLVGLIFWGLLFGAALMANVTDGPMRDHRGSWVTHASIGR